MTDFQLNVLSEAYQNYLNGINDSGYDIQELSSHEKQQLLTALDYLEDKGLIEYTARTFGFVQFKLSSYGIDFAENDFKELKSQPIVTQGSNSIYIHGSGNTVSDNYNQITIDINNSDLPPECKELINTFLYELKNPSLSKEKKIGKINQFLSDISSGTLSGVAASALTTLLSTLFEHITL